MAHEPHVFIIGGGLAGMTVAKELAKRQVPVTVLERSSRLGGKAGADPVAVKLQDGTTEPALVDHGYHVFPAWYLNVRALLGELKLTEHLIDIECFHHLHRPTAQQRNAGQHGRIYSYSGAASITGMLRGVFSGEQPWHQSILAAYFFLDLMGARLTAAAYLDSVSVIGLLRSRFYRSEAVARFHNENVLQASSIPAHDLSAMTLQNVAKSFLAKPKPFFSILDGDLQTTFIDPFARCLQSLGVRVDYHQQVSGFDIEGTRVSRLRLASNDGEHVVGVPQDLFVLATPQEVTARFVDGTVYSAEHEVLAQCSPDELDDVKPLSGLHHLVSEPMAAFHLWLQPQLKHLPAEPVVLYGSRFRTSFVDISQHWAELKTRDMTVLSVIASDYKQLKHVDQATRVKQVVAEILEYLPAAKGSWMAVDERAHINEPLFLNTVGSWAHRPRTRTVFPNLFIAGDYCQTDADLTSMESAVGSGLATAAAILTALGKPAAGVGPQVLKRLPWWVLKPLKFTAFPVVAVLGGYNLLERERKLWRKHPQRAGGDSAQRPPTTTS